MLIARLIVLCMVNPRRFEVTPTTEISAAAELARANVPPPA
jgi:hypothetical protein